SICDTPLTLCSSALSLHAALPIYKFGGWAIAFRDERGAALTLRRPVVVAPLKRRRHLCAEEFAYLRGRTDRSVGAAAQVRELLRDRKSTRLNSSHVAISYAVFCLK